MIDWRPGAAAAVELVAGDGDGEVGGERGPAGDAGGFAGGIALREDDIVDAFGIDLGALDEGLEDDRAEVARLHRGERALELADRGADRADDGGAAELGHVRFPWIARNIAGAARETTGRISEPQHARRALDEPVGRGNADDVDGRAPA